MLEDGRGGAAEAVLVDEDCSAVSGAGGVYARSEACRELSGESVDGVYA